MKACSVDSCNDGVVARGFCNRHYLRWRKHGDPLGGNPSPKVRKAVDLPGGKRLCTACDTALPIDLFDLDPNGSGGRRAHCKPCRSVRMKAWYAANRERQRNRQRDRYEKWPTRIQQQDRERYERHRERRILVALQSGDRRRARMAGVAFDPTVTRANLRRQYGDDCHYCGVLMTFKRTARGDLRPDTLATLEHVYPVSRGGEHTWENVVLACWRCNITKNARVPGGVRVETPRLGDPARLDAPAS